MTPHPDLPTITRVRRLMRPTVYRIFLASESAHFRQFDRAQDAIDWAEEYLPHQAIDMQLS